MKLSPQLLSLLLISGYISNVSFADTCPSLDSCLIGVWKQDLSKLSESMPGTAIDDVKGESLMQITDELVWANKTDYAFTVKAAGMGITSISETFAQGKAHTSDGKLFVRLEFMGGEVGASTMKMPFQSVSKTYRKSMRSGREYTCDGDSLTIQGEQKKTTYHYQKTDEEISIIDADFPVNMDPVNGVSQITVDIDSCK